MLTVHFMTYFTLFWIYVCVSLHYTWYTSHRWDWEFFAPEFGTSSCMCKMDSRGRDPQSI